MTPRAYLRLMVCGSGAGLEAGVGLVGTQRAVYRGRHKRRGRGIQIKIEIGRRRQAECADKLVMGLQNTE